MAATRKDLTITQKSSPPDSSPINYQSWVQRLLDEEAQFRKQYVPLIIQALWEKCIRNPQKKENVERVKRHVLMNNTLDEPVWSTKVEQAFKADNLNSFAIIFQHVPTSLLKAIEGGEELGVLAENKDKQTRLEIKSEAEIEEKDILSLKNYMNAKQMHETVLIGSAKTGHLDSPNFKDQLDIPFAIHSIGKVFTGVLALLMVEKGIIPIEKLSKQIEIDEKFKTSFLPLEIQTRLSNATLHEVMTHMAGFGEYTKNYEQAIGIALERKEPVPDIKSIEDFFQYADHKLSPSNIPGAYSNTGLLFVGLAIQHAYAVYAKAHKLDVLSYDGILYKYLINEAKLSKFSTHRPTNARYNKEDKQAPHIVGGPAGGYWTTTEELAKFGQWLYNKCKPDSEFKRLVERYGQEFYNADSQEISHNGAIDSSSAYLSVSLKTGAEVIIFSDQNVSAAYELNLVIQRNIFSKENTAKQEPTSSREQLVTHDNLSAEPLTRYTIFTSHNKMCKHLREEQNNNHSLDDSVDITDDEMAKSDFGKGSNTAKNPR